MQGNNLGNPTPAEIKELLQQSILRHYPNPERKGCQGISVLRELAEQRLPHEDSRWPHVERCSPCYQEFLNLRREFKEGRNRQQARTKWLVAAASAMIVVALSVWSLRDRLTESDPQLPETTPRPAGVGTDSARAFVNASLDFRNQSVTRSPLSQETPATELARVPRGRLALTIILPLGSEPGDYTIRLLKTETDPMELASFSGSATIESGLTILRVSADLSMFERGGYVLAIRRGQESLRYYRFDLS